MSPAEVPACAAPTSGWRSTCTSRSATSRAPRRRRFAAQTLRRARHTLRRHGRARHRHRAGVLLGRPRAPSPTTTSPPAQLRDLADRAAERGHAHRLRGARLGPAREHLGALLGHRRAAPTTPRSACAWTASTCSPARGDVAGIAEVPGEKIFFLQLADAPSLRMDVLQWSRHHRLFPGQGGFDLPGFVAPSSTPGYAGPLSLEVFNDVFRQADPARTAVDATRSLLDLAEAKVDDGAGLDPAPTSPRHGVRRDRRRRRARRCAYAPRCARWASPAPAAPLQAGRAAGSRARPRCCSTPPGPRDPAPDAAISGPGRRRRRTRRRRRPARGRAARPAAPASHGAREAELPAVTAPDGTALFLCGPEPRLAATSCRRRTPTAPAGRDAGRPGRRLPPRLPASTTSRSPSPSTARTRRPCSSARSSGCTARRGRPRSSGPFGLVRSRRPRDAGDRVRLASTSSLLRRGAWAPGVPAPQ